MVRLMISSTGVLLGFHDERAYIEWCEGVISGESDAETFGFWVQASCWQWAQATLVIEVANAAGLVSGDPAGGVVDGLVAEVD